MRWIPKNYHIHELLFSWNNRLLLLRLHTAQQVHEAADDRGGAVRRVGGSHIPAQEHGIQMGDGTFIGQLQQGEDLRGEPPRGPHLLQGLGLQLA